MEKQQIYDTIIKNLPIGFTIVDEKGITIDLNEAAEKITGYSKNEVIGKPHLEIFHGTHDKKVCPLFVYAFKRQEPMISIESTIKKKDGEPITILLTATPIYDHEENFLGGFELFRDISIVKKLESERKYIFSSLAHDMKNPIVASLGFLSRLLAGKVEKQQQQSYLELIRNELKTAEELITNFLNFSRFEEKEYKPTPAPFNIADAINKQIGHAKILADEKNINLVTELPVNTLPAINADAEMIQRVVNNLLDNALKFTNPEGTITVRLFNREKDFLIQIADTGIGMPNDQIPYVFEAFYQGVRDQKGSGLGLSIAKTIVEAHGGEIWAECTLGKGCTFSFTLPKR